MDIDPERKFAGGQFAEMLLNGRAQISGAISHQ
jgi:hypothetical protein